MILMKAGRICTTWWILHDQISTRQGDQKDKSFFYKMWPQHGTEDQRCDWLNSKVAKRCVETYEQTIGYYKINIPCKTTILFHHDLLELDDDELDEAARCLPCLKPFMGCVGPVKTKERTHVQNDFLQRICHSVLARWWAIKVLGVAQKTYVPWNSYFSEYTSLLKGIFRGMVLN